MQQYDLAVIGGGSAGLTAALEAVGTGARVALIERSGRYGGTCRYVGCVPSKALLHSAQVLHTLRRHAAEVGLPAADPAWDFRAVLRHAHEIIRRAGGDDGDDAPRDFYEQGGAAFTGAARFRDDETLLVGEHELRARRVIIATGSRPRIPPIDGLEATGYHTWETIFDLDRQPASLLIIGGGPLAIEFAQMFCRFGTAVTVLETEQQIVPKADVEVAAALRELLADEGVQFHTGVKPERVRRDGDARIVTILRGAKREELRAEQILVAVGTQPNVEDLGLEAAGVELTEAGQIKVDTQLRTTAGQIYACGDVATRYQLTHIAIYEARIAVANALRDAAQTIDERVVPWAVYTEPALAQVGLTEHEAGEQGIAIVSATVPVAEIERGLLVEQQAGLIKAIARRDGGELLGVSLLSPRADDLIHEAALALQQRLPVTALADTIHAYPTFSQGLQQVALALAEQI